MKITTQKFKFREFNFKECYVHARAGALNENDLVMTMQNLNIAGCDDFSPLLVLTSNDGGKSWTDPATDSAFATDVDEYGNRRVGCDATLLFHKKTGVLIVAGHTACYADGANVPAKVYKKQTYYSTYDPKTGKFAPIDWIKIPEHLTLCDCANGCSQYIEEENGDILMPMCVFHPGEPSGSAVFRLGFDGKHFTVKEMGNELTYPTARGIGEASITCYKGKYYQTIRHDDCALWSVSEDGLHFSEPKEWTWDTGCALPSYNTQAHWLHCGGKLYLVYTRKAGNNDHVFRHRAPLFMAEVDVENMTILRHTEQIVVPERGARLGNFGVTQINENKAIVTVTEWMQFYTGDPEHCAKYGSDNSLFITTVEAE